MPYEPQQKCNEVTEEALKDKDMSSVGDGDDDYDGANQPMRKRQITQKKDRRPTKMSEVYAARVDLTKLQAVTSASSPVKAVDGAQRMNAYYKKRTPPYQIMLLMCY